MSVHPSPTKLESYAAGDSVEIVEIHLAKCAECSAHVEVLKKEIGAFRVANSGDAFLAKLKIPDAPLAAESTASKDAAKPAASPSNVVPLFSGRRKAIVPLLAVAAAIAVTMGVSHRDHGGTTALSGGSSTPNSSETHFKGAIPFAIIRDRDGVQERLTGDVTVRPGDRIRIEVSTDKKETLMGGILEDNGDFAMLIAPQVFLSGTRFSDRGAKFDNKPTHGVVLLGDPTAVMKARETHDYSRVSMIHISSEGVAPEAGP